MAANLFDDQAQDLSTIYRDEAAPKDQDPADALYQTLNTAQYTGQNSTSRPRNPNPIYGRSQTTPTPSGTTRPTPVTGTPPAGGQPGVGPAPSSQAVLARLKPFGITSLTQLRSKSDVELRKLSQDVVQYEVRLQTLDKYFFRNADGTYDFTKGPDGQPTGLDATGKVIPPGGAAPGTTPTPAPAPGTAPAPKPAPLPTGSAAVGRGVRPTPTTTTRVTRPPVATG